MEGELGGERKLLTQVERCRMDRSMIMCAVTFIQIMEESKSLHRWQFIKCGAADTIKLQLKDNTLYMHGICKLHTLKGNSLLSRQ